MTANQEAVDPTRGAPGLRDNVAGALKQNGKHVAGLDTGQWRTDTVVDAAPKRHMVARESSPKFKLIRTFEFFGVAIGGSPKQ